jgi:hypothetical protein
MNKEKKDPSTLIVILQYPSGREGHMGLKLILNQLKKNKIHDNFPFEFVYYK